MLGVLYTLYHTSLDLSFEDEVQSDVKIIYFTTKFAFEQSCVSEGSMYKKK